MNDAVKYKKARKSGLFYIQNPEWIRMSGSSRRQRPER